LSATFSFGEGNSTSTGSPATATHITTLGSINSGSPYNVAASDCNWKSVDDCTAASGTAYSAAPIQAGTNSFTKYQFGYFSGTFNQISSCVFYHSAGVFGTGLTLKGTVTSTYATPSQSTNASLTTDMTAVVGSGSGLAVNFSTTSPSAASPTSTLSASGYTMWLATQLQTTTASGPGDSGSTGIVLSLQYNED
jgi:hypothetical protein